MPSGGEDDAGTRAVQHLRESPATSRGRAGHDRDPAIERGHDASRQNRLDRTPDRQDLGGGVARRAGEVTHGRRADEGAGRFRVGSDAALRPPPPAHLRINLPGFARHPMGCWWSRTACRVLAVRCPRRQVCLAGDNPPLSQPPDRLGIVAGHIAGERPRPHVARMPAVSTRSLAVIGRPCNGPASSPRARRRPASPASGQARSAAAVTTASKPGFSASIRSG
jgi:hypothetical protein